MPLTRHPDYRPHPGTGGSDREPVVQGVRPGARALERRVRAALESVPRPLFARESESNRLVPSTELAALVLRALELSGSERVLDIGTGPGYQAALLSRLAREVYSMEIQKDVSESARRTLDRIDCNNVRIVLGDGCSGWPAAAPYHAIVVGGAMPDVPRELIDQLEPGGRLVIPIGDEECQLLQLFRLREQALESRTLGACAFEPLACRRVRRPNWPWVRPSWH